jgi:hypothetical protein
MNETFAVRTTDAAASCLSKRSVLMCNFLQSLELWCRRQVGQEHAHKYIYIHLLTASAEAMPLQEPGQLAARSPALQLTHHSVDSNTFHLFRVLALSCPLDRLQRLNWKRVLKTQCLCQTATEILKKKLKNLLQKVTKVKICLKNALLRNPYTLMNCSLPLYAFQFFLSQYTVCFWFLELSSWSCTSHATPNASNRMPLPFANRSPLWRLAAFYRKLACSGALLYSCIVSGPLVCCIASPIIMVSCYIRSLAQFVKGVIDGDTKPM